MRTHIRVIIFGIFVYFLLCFFPVNSMIEKMEYEQNIKIVHEESADGFTEARIWINPNVLEVVTCNGFWEVEQGHFYSDTAGSELVVKRKSPMQPYMDVVILEDGALLKAGNRFQEISYNSAGDEARVERLYLAFEYNGLLVHAICFALLLLILELLKTKLGDKLKANGIISYYREKKSLGLLVAVLAFFILWFPLSWLVQPTYYTVTNFNNIRGGAVSNIWVDNAAFDVVRCRGYEEVEENHYVSVEENSELVLKKNILYKYDLSLLFVINGEGAYHLIQDGLEQFAFDSYSTERIEALGVSFPQAGASWVYMRVLVFLLILSGILISIKYYPNVLEEGYAIVQKKQSVFWEKHRTQFIVLLGFGVFFMAFFGMMFRQMPCEDDVYSMYRRMLSSKIVFKIDTFGRPIATLISNVLRMLIEGYPHSYNSIPALLVFALAAILSGIIIFNIFRERLEQNGLNVAIILAFSGLMIFNPLMCDLVRFNGARASYVWGIPAALWAARIFLEKQKISAAAVFWLTISLFTYQAQGAYFVIVSCIALSIEYIQACGSDFDKTQFQQLIKKYVNCAICYIIPCVLNRLWLHFVVGSGHYKIESPGGSGSLLAKWKTFWWWVSYSLTSGKGNMTRNILLVILVISGLCFLVAWYRSKNINKSTVLLVTGVTLAVSLCSLFYFQFFMKNIWIDARTYTALPGLPSVFVLPALAILDKERGRGKTDGLQMAFVFIGVIFLGFCLKDTQTNNMKLYATTVADHERTKFYISKIEEYEEESGKEITQVAFTADTSPTWSYSDYSEGSDTTTAPNTSVYYPAWSRDSVLIVGLGREIKQINNIPESVLEIWEGKNWDSLDDEQVVCIGNVAYIILY